MGQVSTVREGMGVHGFGEAAPTSHSLWKHKEAGGTITISFQPQQQHNYEEQTVWLP